MKDHLQALRLFVRVARTRSFSKAARAAGVSQPSVSRLVAGLEREVGVQLVTRTTRAVVVTERGAVYLAAVERLLAGLDEADQTARGSGELRGTLRVGLPSAVGTREVLPRLARLLAPHPALRIVLSLDDERRDLVSEGLDLALRLGGSADSSLVTRVIASSRRLVAASPAYLAQSGRPPSPADLVSHPIVAGPSGAPPEAWTFARGDRHLSVPVAPGISLSSSEGAIAAARAGLGIISTTPWECRPELASGALVPLFEDWTMGAISVNAIYAPGHAANPAARAFVELMAGACGGRTLNQSA